MITCTLNGRAGNQFYILAFLIAYAKKHNLEYHIPNVAYHCDGNKMYFPHIANGPELTGLQEYHEQPIHAVQKPDGTYQYNVPAYQDIPRMDNVKFVGYWQSFKYFDEYRDLILEKFALPYEKKRLVGLHFRRGDFLQLVDKHPSIPIDYYRKACRYFADLGYNEFMIFSDDITWCKENLPSLLPKSINLIFSDNTDELQDLVELSCCKHQVLCYSTFGFIAAWLNRNPNKQIIILHSRFIFGGANADMIPNTFTQLEFE